MIALHHDLAFRPRVGAGLVLLALGAGLSGCSGLGDSYASVAFVDPARYELYDCKQLEAERKSLATNAAELQRLMDKAKSGVAGTVVAQMAYSNDYVSNRAQAKLANEVWERDRCATAATPLSPSATPAPPANATGIRSPARSGSAVY